VQIPTHAEALYTRIREAVNGGVEAAEEKVGRVLEILSGGIEAGGEKVKEGEKGEEKVKKGGGELHGELWVVAGKVWAWTIVVLVVYVLAGSLYNTYYHGEYS
jgi:hypothetical protein